MTGTSTTWATVVCFITGAVIGTAVLWGSARPLLGDGSLAVPAAIVSGLIAAAAFVASTLLHRRGETAPMPRWQAAISDVSAIALTIAFAGVTALGVLLAAQVLSVGLQGLEVPPISGGLIVGVTSALAGRLAFGAGVGLRTADLAQLLLAYLLIGTLFAMLTAADPRWWELNFSTLGIGAGAWVFNGTVMVAGLLTGTVGSYIGRDLHRILGDAALGRIAWVVVLWAGTGIGLAAVGLIPLHRAPAVHNVAAAGALALFMLAGIATVIVMPGRPRALVVSTIALLVAVVVAFILSQVLRVFPTSALEAIVVGLGMLWLTGIVRTLAAMAPSQSRPSARTSLLHG